MPEDDDSTAVSEVPVAVVPVVPGGTPGWARALVALSVLLLSASVGLGTAAAVAGGARTWRSTVVVELQGGVLPTVSVADMVAAGQQLYADRVDQLTPAAARRAGVPTKDVRGDLDASPVGTQRVRVEAEAATRDEAQRLAQAAGVVLVAYVPADQARTVLNEGDRLSAFATGSATAAIKVAPSSHRAQDLGMRVGGVFFLLALTVLFLRRRRSE